MGSHPVNLVIRFLLELIAITSMGIWGWRQGSGWRHYVLGIVLPLAAAIVWGTFAVPDDPSRSGAAPVPVAGVLRLVIEFSLFAVAGWMLNDLGYQKLYWIIMTCVMLHYLASYDRILWLIKQ